LGYVSVNLWISIYTNVTSPLNLAIFNGIQQGKNYGFGGGFYGFGLWEMKFQNIP
jgi:hypothetical protein